MVANNYDQTIILTVTTDYKLIRTRMSNPYQNNTIALCLLLTTPIYMDLSTSPLTQRKKTSHSSRGIAHNNDEILHEHVLRALRKSAMFEGRTIHVVWSIQVRTKQCVDYWSPHATDLGGTFCIMTALAWRYHQKHYGISGIAGTYKQLSH